MIDLEIYDFGLSLFRDEGELVVLSGDEPVLALLSLWLTSCFVVLNVYTDCYDGTRECDRDSVAVNV